MKKLKVSELIEQLEEYNPDVVIAHGRCQEFSLSWGGGDEGETKEDCHHVSFYVDALNQSEALG